MFHGDAMPMAVSVDAVATIVEAEALVPLVWSPPQVVGLCPFHRQVIPVISLVPAGNRAGADCDADGYSARGSSALTCTTKDDGEEEARCCVLILKNERDAWGLRIEHAGTFISRERPNFHPPRHNEHGAVFIGAIQSGDKQYTILDPAATWRGLRSAVARWYGLASDGSA
jgi:chemotaxis signal transduction protein